MMRRILSLWLPHWATDRLCLRRAARGLEAPPPEAPLVLIAASQGTQRLIHLNRAALAAGLRAGINLADARALVPALVVREAAPAAERRDLERLAEWCGRYSPWVACDGADGIRLDVTGVAHLFGGEGALLRDLARRLAARGLSARTAIADSLGAAWALARFAPESPAVMPGGSARRTLGPLPVAALRLAEESVDGLAALGLNRIEQLLVIPPAALAARFGPALTERLAQALGQAPEPISPERPPPWFLARLVFPEPLVTAAGLGRATARLAEELCRLLAKEEKGARRLELTLYLADGGLHRLAVGCSRPSREPEHFCRLFAERLAGLEVGFGADVITLAAPLVETQAPAQLGFGRMAPAGTARAKPSSLAEDPELGLLIDRLGNRLGLKNIARLAPRQSHLPERALRVVAPLAPPQDGVFGPELPRPVRLLPAPEPIEAVAEVPDGPPVLFRWRGRAHPVARADGPERIEPEWWRRQARVRDYYRLEDEAGARFWVYRDGRFETGASPRWYLHGFFA